MIRSLLLLALPAALMLQGCGRDDQPSLVQGLEKMKIADGSRVLTARLKRRFPKGMPVSTLVAGLEREGFTIGRGRYCRIDECAQLESWPDTLGGIAWVVHWSAGSNGRMEGVQSTAWLLN